MMNQFFASDYFAYFLDAMNTSNGSNPFALLEPTITSYHNPVCQPTQLFPDINYHPTFDFNLALSSPSTIPSNTLISGIMEPNIRQKEPISVLTDSVTSNPVGYSNFTFPLPSAIPISECQSEFLIPSSSPRKQKNLVPEPRPRRAVLGCSANRACSLPSAIPIPEPQTEPPKPTSSLFTQKELVPKKSRPRRAALGLRYSNVKDRRRLLDFDPFVREIRVHENQIQCSRCEKFIKLDNRKPGSLQLQNWNTHKKRCIFSDPLFSCPPGAESSGRESIDSALFA